MNNSAAIGYMILSLKYLGYNKEQIREAESEMNYQLDMNTEDEAEEIFRKFV
jgi:Holliday junction resolvasome RuvABC DNA-binding subunit